MLAHYSRILNDHFGVLEMEHHCNDQPISFEEGNFITNNKAHFRVCLKFEKFVLQLLKKPHKFS